MNRFSLSVAARSTIGRFLWSAVIACVFVCLPDRDVCGQQLKTSNVAENQPKPTKPDVAKPGEVKPDVAKPNFDNVGPRVGD